MSALFIALKDLVGGWRALALLVVLVAQTLLLAWVGRQRDNAIDQLTAHVAADAKAEIERRKAAQAESEAARMDVANAANSTEQAIGDRHERVEAVVAGVAAGTVRVRERLTCPAASMPATTPGAAAADDAAQRGLSAGDVQFLVRLAARCGDVQDERNLGAAYARAMTSGRQSRQAADATGGGKPFGGEAAR